MNVHFGKLFLLGWVFAANLYVADLSPGYSEALQKAIRHASDPSGWTPSTLVVIPDTTAGTTEGLVCDTGKLIVRTATKSRWNLMRCGLLRNCMHHFYTILSVMRSKRPPPSSAATPRL